jgi:hypothetical protein
MANQTTIIKVNIEAIKVKIVSLVLASFQAFLN